MDRPPVNPHRPPLVPKLPSTAERDLGVRFLGGGGGGDAELLGWADGVFWDL